MSKITETAKGLKTAAYAVRNNEYIKGFNHCCVITATGALAAIAFADVVTIVDVYIKNKQ